MELLTVGEVAKILRVAPITVRRQIAAGKLPAVRIGRAVRIDRDALTTMVRPTHLQEGSMSEAMPAHEATTATPAPKSNGSQQDIFTNYDPEAARKAWESVRGLLTGVNVDKLKRDIYGARRSTSTVTDTSSMVEKQDIWAHYDPERVEEALEGLEGILKGADTQQLKHDIRAARGQKRRGHRR